MLKVAFYDSDPGLTGAWKEEDDHRRRRRRFAMK